MAANLDKSENSLTSVSTLTYLRGIDASGNSVKISTSDLASVLGETIRSQGSITNLNSVTDSGVYNITSQASNAPTSDGLGLLIVRKYSNGHRVIQFFTDDEAGPAVYYRKTKSNGATWTPWKQFYDTSLLTNSTMLGELASALGEPYTTWTEVLPASGTLSVYCGLYVIGNGTIGYYLMWATYYGNGFLINTPDGITLSQPTQSGYTTLTETRGRGWNVYCISR